MFELVLQVQDIDERGKDYDFELTPSWLDGALSDTALKRNPHAEGGRLHVHAQRNGSDILVTGKVDASLLIECGRCLQEAPLDVHADITALLSPSDDGPLPEDLELAAEDLDRGTFVGHELALDELVREHLLLEVPMQPLCSPDCAGIEIPAKVRPRPEDFGAGATDPRLLPLQQLKAKLSGGKPGSELDERRNSRVATDATDSNDSNDKE
jgi:uncharacterized protein